MNKEVIITRKFEFCAAHKLANDSWSFEKNKEVFGKCSNPEFHGHNYTVWVCLKGPVDVTTGMVFNLTELKKIIEDQIEKDFDHKNLNTQVPEFNSLIPTAENISIVIYNRLKPYLGGLLYSVKIQETSNNFAEYIGV